MSSYPYISGQGGLVQTFKQLRRAVPSKVDAGYLQRFNIAPANESYVISILRFLGIIDGDGNRIDDKSAYLYGSEESFKTGLEEALRNAYSKLFEEIGDALRVERNELVHWFRASDKTSALVGGRQASTFLTLAALAGHGEIPSVRANASKKAIAASEGNGNKKLTKKSPAIQDSLPLASEDARKGGSSETLQGSQDVGITVRIEVNLPTGGDADTYDAIFASIKRHLMS